ncbi:nucleolar protein,Nop52-domain-containing protein [Xylariaceae sp. FL1019]|nr:nucleolar protein,Nop52-domain-containing protein [Xylariaceae sp. FL1019]
MAADASNAPFIRNLASSDRKLRTTALSSLQTFLSSTTHARALTPLDNLKLWKGLYYSLWMCDRPIPQQNLCTELASLIELLPDDAVAPWLAAFWDIIGKEWTSIDVYRLEKFLLLVRRVLGASLAWVLAAQTKGKGKKGKESRERGDILLDVLSSWPFDTKDDLSRVPVGLRLHVLDIWVDEAEKLGLMSEEETGELGRQFLDRLGLVVEGVTRSTCKPVRLRAKESLADERLPWNKEGGQEKKGEEKDGEGDGDSFDGFDD